MMNILSPKPKKDPLRPFPKLETHVSKFSLDTSGLSTIPIPEGEQQYTIEVRSGIIATVRFVLAQEILWSHVKIFVTCNKNSHLTGLFDIEGGKRITIDMQCDLKGERSEVDIRGVFHGVGDTHHGMYFVTHHMHPNTKGNIAIRGVYEQTSRAVFTGLIKIEKEAQKTDSYFRNDVLLFDDALVESLPTLEIEANNVKASHSSTTSRMNDDQLFYMQSRGISAQGARDLIIKGFLGKIPTG
jgi:Fe-S cluster assembly protein SufD